MIANTEALESWLRNVYEDCEEPPVAGSIRLRIERLLHSVIVRPSMYWRVRALFRYLGRLGGVGQIFAASELDGTMRHQHRRMGGLLQRVLERQQERLTRGLRIPRAGWCGSTRRGSRGSGWCRARTGATWRCPTCGIRFWSPNRRVLQWARVGYQRGACPVAETIAGRIVTPPIYRRFTPKSIDRTLAFMGRLKNEWMI